MIAVWFSCGAASAVAAKLTIEKYPEQEVRILNNYIAEEDEDNRRFLRDVQVWLGREIEDVRSPKHPHGHLRSRDRRARCAAGRGGEVRRRYCPTGKRTRHCSQTNTKRLLKGENNDGK